MEELVSEILIFVFKSERPKKQIKSIYLKDFAHEKIQYYYCNEFWRGVFQWVSCALNNTCKNRRKFKIQKKFENLILELPFGIGFIEIHQLARFVQQFEIYGFSRFSWNFKILYKFVKDLYRVWAKIRKIWKSILRLEL